jgi:hypothetical protein
MDRPANDDRAGHAGTDLNAVGDAVDVNVRWDTLDKADPFKCRVHVHFNAGSAIREAGGRDADFVMFSTTYRF